MLDGDSWTNPIWEAVRRHTAGRFAGALAWGEERLDLSNGGEADPIDALMVSGRFFETLGVRPALGRLLADADDRRGGGPDGPTAVISERFWERRFGRDPDITGRGAVDQRRRVHDRRRGAGALPRPLGRQDLRRRGADRHHRSRPAGRPAEPARRPLDLVAEHHAAPPARPVDRGGHGGAPRRPAADPPRITARGRPAPGDARRFLSGPLTLEPASTGLSELRRHYREPLIALAGIVGAGAAHRLRQRREPAAGARRGAPARARGAPRARRLARPPGPPAADREPAARRARRDRRPRARGLGIALPGGADRPHRRSGRARAAARLAAARLPRRALDRHGDRLRPGAGAGGRGASTPPTP